MAHSTEFENPSHHYENIEADILARLKKIRQQFPERFSKPIHVLAAVDDDVNDQWEQRLQQAKENGNGERIILIPYKVGDDHWIGVLLKFKANEQIERADFIDPVEHSDFVPDKLQKQFDKIYSGVILQSRNFQKHDDPEQSATLTVENLLKAAEEAQSTDVKNSDTCYSRNQTFDDRNTSLTRNAEQTSLPSSAVFSGNNSDLDSQKQTTSSVLNSVENKDDFDLPVKVPQLEQLIEPFDNKKKNKDIKEHKKSLQEPEELPSINEPDQSKVESYEVLKNQLEDGLVKYDISKEELKQKIIDKKERIESLRKKGNHEGVRKRQVSLSELEKLQSLVDKIEVLESFHANDECEVLKKELEDGLVKYDISKEELKQKLIDKKERIESLRKKGNHEGVRKRQVSLSELEKLQSLVDKIEVLESFHADDECELLRKELEDGLVEYDISSKEELKQKIIDKKERIECLRKKGNHEGVRKRQVSLSELEKLQSLMDKIEVLESCQSTGSNRLPKQQLNTDHPTDQQLESVLEETPSNIDPPREDECLLTKESLKNMYQDFHLMPICAERSIISLLFYVSLKLADNTVILDGSIKIPDQIDTEIDKEFECLKERLKIEEFESKEIDYSVTAASINVKDKNWKCAITALSQLLKQLYPLDIHELFRLVEKVEEAASLIKNKEIILFLGGTGSGKSTTIHFLSGSKMVKQLVNNLNHIAPTEIKNTDLKKITTSPFARSETRYITPVKVNYSDVGAYSSGSVILCDSPGFEDTSGPEVDIANGVGIIKAIKGCKSVKPVVLISSKKIGDRGDGIKDLAHLLTGLIPGIIDHINAFSYIFTKFSAQETKAIHALLKDINDNLNETEKSDNSFKTVLIDMLEKTENGARILDPLKDHPKSILNELARSASIPYPEEVFQFFITQKSKTIVQEHIRVSQLGIKSATKRSEYSFVKYKLDHLKRLHELLNQDNIEQIYNECVRHINKHLSDEYQNGTSMLDRCLMNQTILNVEDIQQYQTCIAHAKLAEELRSIHLGKEVVHSSAFILHLNQQIDILCADLREKDIDDSFVKVNLDKIKLISDFFPDVNCKYKESCQFFSEKFESVVRSFKASVLSNKFSDSANNITKLNNARMILHDHLDHEHMQVKYVELQKCFFDYLNDAVRRLNNILTKEKLEKTDIDSLNNCVCILQSATSTFALEPHISIKDIGIIYENLLSQILNYVDKIIEKIDTGFKNENSFHVLEQYMEQLDLIRTIPIVSLKTSESYWKTLEKLVGYVQESKRDIEEQLRILCQREGKVDYKKLMKSLSSLKGAEWIEKYRNGIYSDVINAVEQQLIQHIETLKESIMEVDLSLDNFDKIKQVHDIILEINEMKPIEKIVCGVSEHINAVNSWFEGVTNNVFNIIKDTFNIEKWKEQGHPILDFNKAEKAFSYLNICKSIRILVKSGCMSVLNSLEEFIRYYSDFVQKEMENDFDFIKQFENKNKEEICEKARTFVRHLHEISEIKTTYPQVLFCFSNKGIVEKWKKELSDTLTELSEEMEILSLNKRTESLNNKLSVAKAFSRVDSFLEGEKYLALYYKYQKTFFSQIDGVCKQVIDSIAKTEYERVAHEMAVLKSSSDVGEHFYKQAKRALIVGLDNLMEETKNQAISLGNNIDKEQIKPIVENLRRLQKAKQFVSEFLDAPEEIDKCIHEVKQLIEERIKHFLKRVQALTTINNFCEADKKIDSITLVRTLLGNYCTPDVFKQIDDLKERQNKVVLEDVVKKYSEMDLSSYTLNPPTDIFAKFEEVNNTNPIYHQALNIIKERILDKFRKELEHAKSQRPPNPENVHTRNFESAVKHLPDEMRKALEIELKNCKEDITSFIREKEIKLENALKSGDLNSIGNVFEEYQKSEGMQCYANRVRDDVLKQMQELTLIITQNFEKHEIAEALNNVKKLYDYKIKLEKLVDGTKQFYSDVRSRIKSTFQDAYSYFTNRFLNNNNTNIPNDTIETVEKSFICLIEFLKFNYEHRDQPILTDMLPDDFTKKTVELNKNILQYLTEQQKKNEDALEKLDITSLKNALDKLKRWNSLIMKMKSYDTIYSIDDPFVIPITNAMKELKSYPEMLELVSHQIKKLRDELIDQELINNDTKEYDKQRNEFYRKLNEFFLFLNKANLFDTYGINIDIREIEQECLESLQKKISNISCLAQDLVEKLLSTVPLMRQDSDNFNLYYNNLLSFKQEMKVKGIQINEKIEIIKEKVICQIHTWEKSAENETNFENIAKCLIIMKRTSNNMPSFAREIKEGIDAVLYYCKNRTNCPINLGKLGIILQQEETGVGLNITSEHKAFEGYTLSVFNEKTRRHGIEYVLDYLMGDSIDKNRLIKRYDEFHSIYQSLIKQYLKTDVKLDALISGTILITGNIRLNTNCMKWDGTIRAKIPNLAAHVFAVWTLQHATHYFEAADVDKQENYLRQPHAAQIISIFRMLGIGDKDEELKNNLVQIGTGEGKSITLGATAAILALLGFDVRCACYSEYLSQRDYAEFRPLFDSLSLLEYIHYGTFNKLCEDMINENGNIRQTVEQLISKGSNNILQNHQQTKRPKILLIDEVDVFFSRDFFGNVYTPSASLRDQTITSLINLIWKERDSKLTLRKVKNTDEYKACCNRFPNWEPLIQEAIKDMLFDVNNFQSHDYVVTENKIGYIEQNNIVYNVVYGYKTLFAYYCEHEKGNVSRESLEEHIGISIKCGSFSYAEIPLDFKYIMGVTGTLKTLSEPEIRVIENVYKIMKKTYTPSVFGENNLRFIAKDDIKIESESNYFNVIRREIDDRLVGRSSAQRAVLVLFESKQKLEDFYDSEAIKPIKHSVVKMTEEVAEKEYLIKRATTSGQITLLTRTFGRGTDFVCYDREISASGGVHVIQTFLSEELSEEVQIKGRTARQGDYGSYSMILLDRDLEKFQIEKEHIEDVKKGKGILLKIAGALHLTKTYDTVYDLLNDKRNNLFKTQYEANMKYVEQAKERHLSARKFLLNLNSGDIDSVRKFLVEENKGAEGNSNSRTVCLMDATGSMTHLLHKCKNTVDIMVNRASEILQDNGISSNSFQIQFVVYRNYNSKEDKILQSSPWETKPDNLRAFMNTIEVEGGWSNEAIEIGLWHANRENEREPITQVILIGDAPPNTPDEVEKKREKFGENYWKKTRFAQATYYENELAKLISNNIPVHAFFVDKDAEVAFKTIASRTGGRCEMLDINSSSGAQMLTDLVTEEILRNVGGSSKGNALVQAYRDKFWKSYT